MGCAPDRSHVFKITDDRIRRQNIQFSLQNLTRVEVTSGLSEGDQVALPAEEIKPMFDGASAKVIP